MSAATQLQAAANGQKKPADHPTIVRIQAQADKFAEAMPSVMTRDRFMRIAIGAIRRNPKLLECDALSLMGSLLVAAQLGLEVNTPLGHFYLIPRWNKKTGKMEADGQIGYKGWLELLERTNLVTSMTAEVVHEKDHFVYRLGDDPGIEHVPHIGDRGKAVAYYVSIKLANGGVFRKVLSRSDVEKYRARSQSPNAGPWISDFDAMALKTVFLRLVTWLPKSLEIKRAAAYENTIEANGTVKYSERQGQIEYVVPEPAPVRDEPEYSIEDDGEEIDVEFVEKPEPEPEPAPPPKAVAKPAPRKRTAPAKPAEPIVEQKAGSSLAGTVKAIEDWFAAVTAQNAEGGLTELAEREGLMEWIWPKLTAEGHVNGATSHWYSRLNELAKAGGDTAATLRMLDAALKSVRADYLGEPAAETVEAVETEDITQPPKESAAEKLTAIERWIEKAAEELDRQGAKQLVMPSAALGEIYGRLTASGVIGGQSTGYRQRLIDLSEIPGSSHDVIQTLKPYCKAIIEDLAPKVPAEQWEPGADG